MVFKKTSSNSTEAVDSSAQDKNPQYLGHLTN